ncbi:hypothetical protein KGF54_002427 [Candida jiufengensis]|uniref:uncharacterized protein n=1 Tax=Candida jiufengensis TaxID=497108 RepID=UPI002224AE69|nr:uncharacterized protein KGF54_002427 [Candida jiufengensis]KAI5954651.1 hypothetical protein KGF54_002427 [Candida jiufengensis]
MAKLFNRIFKGIIGHNKNNPNQKLCKNTIPFIKIPLEYNKNLGNAEITNENKLNDETLVNNLEVFNLISENAILFIIQLYELIEDLNLSDLKEDCQEENDLITRYRIEFDEKFKVILNNLIYVRENKFEKRQLDLLKFLFMDLKNTRNVILLSNKLKLNNINETLKTSVYQYFKDIWCFEISTDSNDEFLIDLYSVSLKIWEMKIISLIVSKEE